MPEVSLEEHVIARHPKYAMKESRFEHLIAGSSFVSLCSEDIGRFTYFQMRLEDMKLIRVLGFRRWMKVVEGG
jgi:hypothetical protein